MKYDNVQLKNSNFYFVNKLYTSQSLDSVIHSYTNVYTWKYLHMKMLFWSNTHDWSKQNLRN